MGIQLGSNFDLNTALPLDARDTVADLTARDAIPSGVRYDGLQVYVASNQVTYQLQGGVTNSDWEIAVEAAGGIKNNFAAVADPLVTNDSSEGYSIGSEWIFGTKIYKAVDVSVGAAVWKRTDKIMFKTIDHGVLDMSSTNITDAAYVQLIADTGAEIGRKLQMFYPDGDALIVAIGAASSEVDQGLIFAGGSELELEVPANSRISLKLAAGGSTNTTGILAYNLLAEA